MRSRKAATSARGLGWYRNKSRPETEQFSAAYQSEAIAICAPCSSRRPGSCWSRSGQSIGSARLKSWIEAAKKRLHHNVLAVALANKLARIAWSVLAHGRTFETSKIQAA